MLIRALALSSALLITVSAHADGNFDRTVTVNGQSDLYVSSNSGHIHIYPGSDSEIHIKAHLKAGGWNHSEGGDVEDRIRRIVDNPPIQQSGNTIRVGNVSPEDRKLFNNISIDYEISAPKSVALNLHSGSGDVDVDNLGRFLKADTGSGSVRAHGIGGPSDLHTGSGDIELQQQAPGEVKTSTGSGSIRINGLNGSLQAHTGSGDIEANGSLTGPATLQSGSGSIRLHIGRDAHFDAEASTGSGSIRISQPGAPQGSDERHHVSASINGGGPSLTARTGSGDIEIN
ncbi:DUF4097 family beta strand repeat-containing protein [Granulicella tundricola]|uniref:DUF4097 domain-containing protein n=1 Tax=Granulicella tundricola (strain ATCC BAA-1859 / DSM 23138 / MP5ACTX9) TaxID=1198114 RepID=E8WWW7_GRATM|nr:DUF4097 family beta strand repeat-containing protein [Granulicella tundricola]ADW68528.1 hypothetical protein AciX9_1475 [Granulicella tundricola MP5ACTX9]